MKVALVFMTIICSVSDGKNLKEIWRIERTTTLDNCLVMNATFSGAGRLASVSVRCEPLDDYIKR